MTDTPPPARIRGDTLLNRIADWRARTPEAKEALRVVRMRAASMEKVYAANLVTYGRLIDTLGIDVVFLMEDTIGPDTPVLMRAAQQRGVPVVILPYTMADEAEALESLKDNPRFQISENFNWLGLGLPRAYHRRHKGRQLLRLPYAMARAHHAAGYTPPNPWVTNSGDADAIVMEGERARTYYLENGFPAEQLAMVGLPYEDALAPDDDERRSRYAALCAQHGLDPAKPLLLVSAPPNQLSAGVPDCDYENFESLCADLAAALKAQSDTHNVVVCMHPNFRDQAPLFTQHGLAVHDGDMMALMPLARIFVAFASATLRWAIGAGVPAIDYDVYGYGYDEFATPGVLQARKQKPFEAHLARLCQDEAFYAEVADKQRNAQAQWAMADGRSVERMRALVDRLIADRGTGKSGDAASLTALTLILRPSDCAEAIRSAIALRAASIEPVFTFSRGRKPDTPACRESVERSEAAGVRCVTLTGEPFDYSGSPAP